MKFKLHEMLIRHDDIEFPLDAWDVYDELALDYSDRQIIEILVNHNVLPKDMLVKYDNDEIDMYDDVLPAIENLQLFEIDKIPELQEVIYDRLIPEIENELTSDIPYQYKGDWE